MKIRKIINSLLIIAVMISVLSAFSVANAATYGDLTYKISNGEVTITDCNTGVTSVTIPSEIGGYPVTTIGHSAFFNCDSLVSIIIPDSVTLIDDWAFRWCTIENVTIGNGVKKIGDRAFEACYSLVSIEIPGNVTSIGEYAFYSCGYLENVTIGKGVKKIGDYAFRHCLSLVNIEIPDSVTSIGIGTFADCRHLGSVTLGRGITEIDNGAFNGCTSFRTVNYNGTVWDSYNIKITNYNDSNAPLLNATWNCHTHSFDSDCDATCNSCDFIRDTEHSWGEWMYNEEDNTESRTCNICQSVEMRDITENPTYRPDEHMPVLTLNKSGNAVVLDQNKSWATRVYWGRIGNDFVEYKWFDEDFRLLCGTDYFADYTPKQDEVYNFTKKGWYRFVVKAIRTGTTSEDYTYSELVYDFYYDGKVGPTVPTIVKLDNNQVKIKANGTKIKKFYYGNIGQTNTPYSWFNDFWGLALGTKTYTPVFDTRDGRIITLPTKGYYNIVIVASDNTEYVYTTYTKMNAPIIRKTEGGAVVDIEYLNGNLDTKATLSRVYYGYVGTNDKKLNNYDQIKANTTGFTGDSSAVQGKTYTLKNKGYYKFLAVVTLSNGRVVELVYTIQN